MATFKYFIFWRFTSFVTVNGLQDKLVYLDGKWLSEYTIFIASLPKKWKEKLNTIIYACLEDLKTNILKRGSITCGKRTYQLF